MADSSILSDFGIDLFYVDMYEQRKEVARQTAGQYLI